MSYALVSSKLDETFAWLQAVPPARGEAAREGGSITVANPLSSDHSILRQNLIGSLVEVVQRNVRHGNHDVLAFEVGKGYGRVGAAPREWWRLGLALTGAVELPAWNQPRREADLDDAKGVVELIASQVGAGEPAYRALTTEPILHPGRSATVESTFEDGQPAITGVIGELHPRLADEWDLRGRVIVGELSIAGLGGGALPVVLVEPLPKVQPIERDLTVDVPDRVPAADVSARIREAGGPLLLDATLTGTYRGKPLGPEERSLTHRLRFGAGDRALDDAEVEAAIGTITAALQHHLGARIRS